VERLDLVLVVRDGGEKLLELNRTYRDPGSRLVDVGGSEHRGAGGVGSATSLRTVE
jgi:hypothetical protein